MYVFGSGRRWRRGCEWMRGLGLGFTNPVCLCFGCGGVADICGECTILGVGWCYLFIFYLFY